MEETTKKTKASKSIQTDKTQVDLLKESGIPLKRVVLSYAVLFSGSSETAQREFHDPSTNPRAQKRAKCWFTPHALIIERNNETKILPPSLINDSIVL